MGELPLPLLSADCELGLAGAWRPSAAAAAAVLACTRELRRVFLRASANPACCFLAIAKSCRCICSTSLALVITSALLDRLSCQVLAATSSSKSAGELKLGVSQAADDSNSKQASPARPW